MDAPAATLASSAVLARETLAPVMEVFASFQGEGRFVGEPQVFVRLFGCPLRCRWCDTPGSWHVPVEPRARLSLGGGARFAKGWATPQEVADWVAAAEPARARTISVTGGEPLLWPGFLRALRECVGRRRVHLETAGAHPDALAEVLGVVDHVSLDLKLPSDLEEPEEVPSAPGAVPRTAGEWAAVRARVLALVRGRDACGKLILAGDRSPSAFAAILADVAAIAPELPLFVQPVTRVNGVPSPSRAQLSELVELVEAHGLGVRVVPQVHRMLGVP